jgi:hypothetical protein
VVRVLDLGAKRFRDVRRVGTNGGGEVDESHSRVLPGMVLRPREVTGLGAFEVIGEV